MKQTSVGVAIHPVNRGAALLLAAVLVGTGVLAILPALHKPFTLDETEKAMFAKSVASVRGLIDACKTIAPALA